MKKKSFYLFIFVICSTLIAVILAINFNSFSDNNETDSKKIRVTTHNEREHSLSYKSYNTSVTLAAIGDILIHDRVYEDAKTDNGYNFKPMLVNVKKHLESADLTIANQETMIGGIEMGLSSYPSFNSPVEIVDALTDAGVDIVSIANNHTLDRGEKAIQNATYYYRSINLPYVGSYKNLQDKNEMRIISKNGIKLGFLSYTYGTNGIPVPTGKPYLVNLINKTNISADIKKMKPHSDVVIVSMHWGNEYQRIPTSYQKALANYLANEGADLIIGHHPHVLQPMEWIQRNDGGKSFVAYSLGNFLSGQVRDYKDIGGVLNIEIEKELKDNKAIISLKNPSFIPTYVSSHHQKNYQVVPLEEAATVGLKNVDSVFSEINKHMFQWITAPQ